jgi:hypothetical protein
MAKTTVIVSPGVTPAVVVSQLVPACWRMQVPANTGLLPPSSLNSRKPALSEIGLPFWSKEMLPVHFSDSSQPMYMSLKAEPK